MRSTHKPQVITFTGTGGSGKTAVAEVLKGYYKERIAIAPSFTRMAYTDAAKAGLRVKTEASAMTMSDEDFGTFQVFVFESYLKRATEFIKHMTLEPGVETILLERSPFCYLTYISTLVMPGYYHTPSLLRQARAFMAKHDPHVVYFPHNSPWYKEGKTNDGLRKVDPKKDHDWDVSLLAFLCAEKLKQVTYLDTWDLNQRVATIVSIITRNENLANGNVPSSKEEAGLLDSGREAEGAGSNEPGVQCNAGLPQARKVVRVARSKS